MPEVIGDAYIDRAAIRSLIRTHEKMVDVLYMEVTSRVYPQLSRENYIMRHDILHSAQ